MAYEVDAVSLVHRAMDALARKRPIFHSEADFQHALAWEIQTAHPTAALRLEKRVAVRPSIELDLAIDLRGVRLGVEVAGEQFTLSTGADDHARYFAIEDLARLERLVAEGTIDSGVLVLLTNVANMWEPPASRRRVLYEDFRMHEGHVLVGTMAWGGWGAAGGRPSGASGTVTLTGGYPLAWRNYSAVEDTRFRYLLISVGEPQR